MRHNARTSGSVKKLEMDGVSIGALTDTNDIEKEAKKHDWNIIKRVLNLIAIILTSLLSAVFLFMYFAYEFHSMYLFNCLLCNQGLIMLVVLRRKK